MSIPASQIVNINPGVIGGGGNSLAMNGLFLTQNTQMSTGTVLSFASPAAVSKFFGAASAETAAATIYFAGYNNSTIKPGAILFAPFNLAARDAFLQSGSLAGLTLAQLQALTGTLIITMNGTLETSAAINFAGVASFTAAAALIQAGFTAPGFTVAWSAVFSAFVFTDTTAGATSTLSFATGTLATALALTSATGALLSQGAAADTPATAMANAVAVSQNWVSFTTLWEPVLTDKENFSLWSGAQNDRYLYIAWDSDVNASVQGNTTCFAAVALAASYNGVTAISGDPALATSQGVTLASLVSTVAYFVAGAIASINFKATNGRVTLAFLASSVVAPTCSNQQTSINLAANGYNFYGSYATANQGFVFLFNGQMFGAFAWINSYVNQIYMNSQFQLAMLNLETQIGSIPFTASGYGLIRAALLTVITPMLAFGAIRAGVTLSAAQIAIVNQAAGVDAATQIQNLGYYLQILDPGATVRAAHGSPLVNFWYADGDDVQMISMSSTAIL